MMAALDDDVSAWLATAPDAALPVSGALEACRGLWLTAPAVAAAAGTSVADAGLQLSTLTALGLAETREARYRAAGPMPPAGPGQSAAVRGLADWYLLSVSRALAEAGTAEAYWRPPARPGHGPELAPQPFADPAGAHAWLLGERETLPRITASAAAAGLSAHAWQLAALKLQVGLHHADYSRWEATVATALEQAGAAREETGRAAALHYQGCGLARRGLVGRAEPPHLQALEIRERNGDAHGQAQSHNALGLLALRRNEPAAALAYFRRCEQIADACGGEYLVAIGRLNQGEALRTQGRLEESVDRLHLAAVYLETHGRHQDLAGAHQILSDICGLQGRAPRALELARRALDRCAPVPSPPVQARALCTLARALLLNGEHEPALDAARASAALHRAAADPQREAEALELAAEICAGLGRRSRAGALNARAGELRRRLRAEDEGEEA